MSTQTLQDLHDCYCQMTGKCATYAVNEAVYHDFLKKGFTCADLRTVLEYLLSENRRMRGAKFSTRHDKLFDWEFRHFDGLLSEARSKFRNRRKPKTGREQVLAMWQKPVSDPIVGEAKTVKDILRKIMQ